MPIQILMPALSPTMTEGKLASWLKKEGDTVSAGDVIAEIETDKATMEVEAVDEGVLGKIIVDAGTEGVEVNAVIAWLLEEGEDASAIPSGETAPAAAPATPAPPPESPVAAPATASPAPAAKASETPARGQSPDGRVFASPLARRLAKDGGLDLSRVTGTGPHGRIVKKDVEAALAAPRTAADTAAAPAPEAVPSAAPTATAAETPGMPSYREIPNSTMRKVIARRLSESKQQAPHFYLTIDCTLDRLMDIRKQLNERAPDGVKISVNDMIIKASAAALVQVPEANASWTEEAIRIYDQVDISVAVAIEGGLITPVIRNAAGKGLATIAAEMKDLASRARDGKLKPEEFQGGTFSISNLGMFGIREFAAVINPPQGAILAVGQGEQRPIVKNGALAIATQMSCTLSVDHRVVDGAVGAAFLAAFKKVVEDPLTLML